MVHSKFSLILVMCVFLYGVGAFAQDPEIRNNKSTVHGYITDTTPDQLPIDGVRVQIDNMQGQIYLTKSAKTGEFIYRDIPAGDYVINFSKRGYQSRIGLPVSIPIGENHYVPVTMNKKENIFTGIQNMFRSKELQGGTLELLVTTQLKQPKPIENAEVKIRAIHLEIENTSESQETGDGVDEIDITDSTDANGRFRRDNLSPGVYIITVSKKGYRTTSISMPIEENRITTTSVRLAISDETSDTDDLPTQKTDTKSIVRGKVFKTNFQQTPVSGVEVVIRGINIESEPFSPIFTNSHGEYEISLLPGRYLFFLYHQEDRKPMNLVDVTRDNTQGSVTIMKEGLFVVYETVSDGNVLELKHGISDEQKSFTEKYGDTIRLMVLSAIMGGLAAYCFGRYLNRRKQENRQE